LLREAVFVEQVLEAVRILTTRVENNVERETADQNVVTDLGCSGAVLILIRFGHRREVVSIKPTREDNPPNLGQHEENQERTSKQNAEINLVLWVSPDVAHVLRHKRNWVDDGWLDSVPASQEQVM